MKILLTSDWYLPAVNGVVTSIMNLKKGLQARGHDVKILTLSFRARSYTCQDVVYIGSVDVGMIYPCARLRVALARKEVQELLEWGPDVVHSNCEFSTYFLAHEIARKLNIPLIHTYHTVYQDYTHYFAPNRMIGQRIAREFSRWTAGRAQAVIAPTAKVAEILRGYDLNNSIYVVPTGIDAGRLQPLHEEERQKQRQQLGISAGHTVLLYLGRLAHEKNCQELIRAMVPLKGRPVTLLLVGDGPARKELEQLACTLNVEQQVVFAGMVPPEQVGEYYALGDLFVSASVSEAQGLTYAEALLAGLPLLCRRDGCLNDIIVNGENGWQYQTVDEFVKRVEWFCANPYFRQRARSCAKQQSKRFTVEAFAASVEQVYKQQQAMLHCYKKVIA